MTEFDIVDQRSVRDLTRVTIHACREFIPGPDERARARALIGTVRFAEEQFERIAEGELFDGVESFLPWLEDQELLLPDLLSDEDRIVLVDPRRMRDRAVSSSKKKPGSRHRSRPPGASPPRTALTAFHVSTSTSIDC